MKKNPSPKKTGTNDLVEKLKSFTKDFKSDEKAIIKKFAIQIAKLESDRDKELKDLRKDAIALRKAVSILDSNDQVKEKVKAPASTEKKTKVKKKSGGNRKTIEDPAITEILKELLKEGTELKTDALCQKIGIGYPRFNKYAKGSDSVIVYKGSKKNGSWILKP
jgi:tryptophanyl-tRNA synthetase